MRCPPRATHRPQPTPRRRRRPRPKFPPCRRLRPTTIRRRLPVGRVGGSSPSLPTPTPARRRRGRNAGAPGHRRGPDADTDANADPEADQAQGGCHRRRWRSDRPDSGQRQIDHRGCVGHAERRAGRRHAAGRQRHDGAGLLAAVSGRRAGDLPRPADALSVDPRRLRCQYPARRPRRSRHLLPRARRTARLRRRPEPLRRAQVRGRRLHSGRTDPVSPDGGRREGIHLRLCGDGAEPRRDRIPSPRAAVRPDPVPAQLPRAR